MTINFPGGTDAFLKDYWQKRPCLIRAGFSDFQDPLDADELAGLAMEADVESRLVARTGDDWQVEHGPFEQFPTADRDWTLLVQAVDHWLEDANALMSPFRFIPNWRIDDLMVSFSVPGGGVGPHLDQYDVFIIQGSGRRHWRVGDRQPLKSKLPHPSLLQVEPFEEALIDAELEPGDILYIPPGFPHEGWALAPSLNYSVGFRAPSGRDLLTKLADYAIDHECFNDRYADPDLLPRRDPGEIQRSELKRLKAVLQTTLEDEDKLYDFLGRYLSEAKHELDLAPPEPEYGPDDIQAALLEGERLHRLPGARTLYLAGNATTLYLDGEAIRFDAGCEKGVQALANREQLSHDDISDLLASTGALTTLAQLVNAGYWYFPEP
ncbi:cupin domain-containing protein [Gallaecimonas sp. GXIMD4217]|uniref:ribosomal protein uL16 3-hydroxylase n=1 Tax=Gallaecimonas sp. GXIMD4217 TaxID=3131927 RepID=UPI00311AF4CC